VLVEWVVLKEIVLAPVTTFLSASGGEEAKAPETWWGIEAVSDP